MTGKSASIITEVPIVTLLTEAVECAAHASVTGDPPWVCTISGDAIELQLRHSEDRSTTDPLERDRIVGCGAALENIKVALRRWGYVGRVKVLPDESRPDFLARVTIGRQRAPSRLDTLLYRAAMKRPTAGDRYSAAMIPVRLIAAMGYAAELEGAWLKQMTDEIRRAVIASLVTGSDRAAVRDASFVAGIVTQGDTVREWLIAGQALQLVRLIAAAHGISASVFSEPIRVAAFRARLRPLIGPSGSPQVMIHMGYLAPKSADAIAVADAQQDALATALTP
jgi:hypothetical protein